MSRHLAAWMLPSLAITLSTLLHFGTDAAFLQPTATRRSLQHRLQRQQPPDNKHLFPTWTLPDTFIHKRAVDSTLCRAASADEDSGTTATSTKISQHNDGDDQNDQNDDSQNGSVWSQNADASARAGKDGFSVTRRPVASWDAAVDPTFEVPTNLDETATSARYLDETWWTSKARKSEKQNSGLGYGQNTNADTDVNTRTLREQAADTLSQNAALDTEAPYDVAASLSIDVLGRSTEALDFPRVLRALSDACSTTPARRLVQEAVGDDDRVAGSKKRRLVPRPPPKALQNSLEATIAFDEFIANDVQGAQRRYRAVQELQWLLESGNGSGVRLNGADCSYRNQRGIKQSLLGRPAPIGSLSFDLEPTVGSAAEEGRVLEGEDIQEISLLLGAMQDVQLWGKALEQVEKIEFTELTRISSVVSVNETLKNLLEDAFDRETGLLSGTTFPTIGRLRARVRSLKSDIMSTLEGILALPSVSSKLATESGGSLISEVSGGRLVIPIESKKASSIGIVHESSRSGKTSYVEPSEIIGPTNELRQVESELRSEEARIWRSLTSAILLNRKSLEQSAYAIGQLDLVHARYRLGQTWSGVIPTVADEGVISLKNARHPVLLLRKIPNVVGNDVELGVGENRGLVLTGVNSGGKTLVLKLLGLCALLCRSGIPVPADGSPNNRGSSPDTRNYHPRIDLFNPVLADIGNDIQSVGDLSTFQGHMLVCREMLAQAGKNALVLMDEVGSGTDPAQGVAIAQALLESLIDAGARIAITTHFMQLKQLAAADERFAVAGMQFIRGRPTYKLLPGTVGESFAIAVAERMKIPSSVLERANELLDSDTRQMGDLLRELEDQKARIEEQAAELETRQKEMRKRELEMKEQLEKLEKKQLTARRIEAKKFAEKLEEKERVLEDVLEKLKQDPSKRIIANSWDEIKFVKREAMKDAENVASVVKKKKEAAAVAAARSRELRVDLVPISEMKEKPDLQPGDSVVCCSGQLQWREGTIVKASGGRLQVMIDNECVNFKTKEVALRPESYVPPKISQPSVKAVGNLSRSGVGRRGGRGSISKAAERALASEKYDRSSTMKTSMTEEQQNDESDGPAIRTPSNTVDVRGCTFYEAQEKIQGKISGLLMSGRSNVIYILHGYGTGGVLRSKIRDWLGTERKSVKKWTPADQSDGGGSSFTRVELR